MKFQSSIVLLLSATIFTGQVHGQSDYCRISRQHTLCQFTGLSPACGQPLQNGFSTAEKAQAVILHNELRARVANGQEGRGPQPPAANMEEMLWDDELANIAQRWAEQCDFGHDTARDVRRFRVGQNVYETSRSRDQAVGVALRDGIMGWYDEVALFNPGGVDRYAFNSGVGHYTQMVWAETNRVGCGHVTYNNGQWIKKLIVCNYGPAGNFLGSPMYKRGAACSMCPTGTTCSATNPGLCGVGGAPAAPTPAAPTPAAPTTTTTAAFNPSDNEIDDGFVPSQPLPTRPTRPTRPVNNGFFVNNNNVNEIDDTPITFQQPTQPSVPAQQPTQPFVPVQQQPTRPANPFNFGGFVFATRRPTRPRPAQRPAGNGSVFVNLGPRPVRRPNRGNIFTAFGNMMMRPMRFFG